jgi:hypothetical protein
MLERASLAIIALIFLTLSSTLVHADWDPLRFSDENTLEFLTVRAEDGEHWSPVWLVVVDGDVYIRLGKRAASRIETNSRAPLTSIRIAGEEFADVLAEPMPGMAEKVAAAMKDKYWTDVFVRYVDHPLTIRLRPVPADPAVP